MEKITDDKLLELLENAEEGGDISDSNTFNDNHLIVSNFIKKLQLDSGEHIVSSRLLYRLFCTVCPNKISLKAFSSAFSKFFMPLRNCKSNYFKLNRDFRYIDEQLSKKIQYKHSRSLTNNYKRFQNFMRETGLGKGNNWLEGYIIYELYKTYLKSINYKAKVINYYKFLFLLRAHFKKKGEKYAVNNAYLKILPAKDIYKIRKIRKITAKLEKLEHEKRSKGKKSQGNTEVPST